MNLVETINFDADVYQIEQTDLVKGGAGEIANLQAQALANRTAFLKDNLYRLKTVEDIVGNVGLTSDDANILKSLTAADHLTATLPDVTTTKVGDYYAFTSLMPLLKCATITTFGAQIIKYAISDNRTSMYMYTGERLVLVSAGTYWLVHACFGNFDSVGESFGARKQKGNTAILNGGLVSRTIYARLWNEFASTLTNNQQIVSDADWLAGSGGNVNVYRGCFSHGDGVTTFRLPDERGLYDRYLDLSRGLATGRLHNYPGGLEMDAIGEHFHLLNLNPNANSQGGFGKITTGGDGPEGSLPIYKSGGAVDGLNNSIGKTETRTKSLGKIPLIRF
jgi:hypothetical protein